MWLPTPSDEAVRRFQVLAKEELGLELDYEQARDEATAVLTMHYLKEHVPRHLYAGKPKEEKPPAPEAAARKKRGRPRKAVQETAAAEESAGPPVSGAFDASLLAVGEEATLYVGPD